MGNFLVVIASRDCQDEASRRFRLGLDLASNLRGQHPDATVETEWARAASFSRQNGSGGSIASDPKTGSWLLSVGSWFHAEGYGSGDESILLDRYLKFGAEKLAGELEGFFTIGIGDARTQTTIFLTDIMGSCHCFARSWKGATALSGSSLLLAGLGDHALDPVGCQEFLCTGIIYEDRTFYRQVRKLGPAAILRFEAGRLRSETRYWSVTDIAPESLDGETAAKALGERLVGAAHKVGRAFPHPVCDLTGGYDSRAVVAAFLTAGVRFSTVVTGPEESADVIVAGRLAEREGLSHTHLNLRQPTRFDDAKKALPLTDGEYDLLEYARILRVHQTLSERFDISINGSYGEVARGYWWELLFPHTGAPRKLDALRIARRRYAAKRFDATLFPPEARVELVSHLAGVIERTNSGLYRCPNTLQMDHAYLTMRMQRWQGRIASSTNQVWPCLSLFLFRSILEIILQTRARARRRSLLIRRMLTRLQPQLAEFPLENGCPATPATWKNFYRFRPLVNYYAQRTASKAARMAGIKRASHVPPSGGLPLRLHLWKEEEVRTLLNPVTMRLASLLDPTALESFLTRSRTEHFIHDDQWTRLLTLEYTIRSLGVQA